MSEKKRAGARLRAARKAHGLTVADLAERFRDVAPERVRQRLPSLRDLERTIRGHEAGEHAVGPRYRLLYARALNTPEEALFAVGAQVDGDDEVEALELARRVAASDVGEETLSALEMTVDELASAYPRSAPDALLARTRRHLDYVARLMDVRMTLAERRRLVVVGAWLSLLAATCDIDLGRRAAADARLRTAAQLARHAGHPEIVAWTLETRAWQAVTDADYREAVALSRGAQEIAPHGGSAFIQATAQEGRAWARLGAGPETRDALGRVERLVAPLAMPERPEHHFRYDPAKSDAYTATTLSWLGDPAAEPYARGVLARLEAPVSGPARPRRAASARLDLALALIAAEQPEEAAHRALEAVTSGRLVPSNYWRAAEVVAAVDGVTGAGELREAYREACGG
ncbi:transcriptional regulator [Actinomadura montaniterrae]|uniref:Transcriptional regulator n=1 Tax=Actinomadura montaniterrae TaxID=1803903 RepID=A0A6L3VS66_9ACTN|nr:transcriptional regulator [Actinomadura montaniterrae]KAB2373628.1 transcriptional regulator [Actinomadura montaniterrae]